MLKENWILSYKGMRKIAVTALVGISVLMLGLIAWRLPGTEPPRESKKLVHSRVRSFPIEIRTLGTLDAMNSHMVASRIRSDEVKIIDLVSDGARVEKGDVLVRLDSTQFEEKSRRLEGEVAALSAAVEAGEQMLEWEKNNVDGEIQNAQFQLTIARLNLKKLVKGDAPYEIAQREEAVNAAREDMEQYRAYLEDLDQLKQQGHAYPAEITTAQKRLAELQGKRQSAQDKLETYRDHIFPLLKEKAGAEVGKAGQDLIQARKLGASRIAQAMSELEGARARLASAQKSLAQARSELDQATITAPFSGIAILYETYRSGEKRKPRVGDLAIQNQPILYLPDISQMEVKTRIREIELHKVALDQKAVVSVEAFPDACYKGRVQFIGALASSRPEHRSGEKYFGITIGLEDGDMRLRPGMTARVSILADRVENALTIPVQALFEHSDHSYCYLFKGGWYKKIKVATGRHNEDYIEVLSGLDEDDAVSLVQPEPDRILSVDS